MKSTFYVFFLITALLAPNLMEGHEAKFLKTQLHMQQKKDSVLRHVVLFKFKDDAPKEKVKGIEDAFSKLPSQIPEIADYEWGLNNSPEGLDKGFTHCFFVSFKSEADRATYLPHPIHKAFVGLLEPYLDDVLVLDYWVQ